MAMSSNVSDTAASRKILKDLERHTTAVANAKVDLNKLAAQYHRFCNNNNRASKEAASAQMEIVKNLIANDEAYRDAAVESWLDLISIRI